MGTFSPEVVAAVKKSVGAFCCSGQRRECTYDCDGGGGEFDHFRSRVRGTV